MVYPTPVGMQMHSNGINTHGGRYGNFSSDLRTPFGDGRPGGR
jgi:hypothetical protein